MSNLNSIGERFGNLTVIDQIQRSAGITYTCLCNCGQTILLPKYVLKNRKYCSTNCSMLNATQAKIGQKYGALTVLEIKAGKQNINENLKEDRKYFVKCDCSQTLSVKISQLKKNIYGCLQCAIQKRNVVHGLARRNQKVPEYNVWNNMKRRCKDIKNIYYKNYGGRGITVCDRWEKFENFYSDMGPRPTTKHELDRIDNDQGYSLANCHWVTKKENQENKTRRCIECFAKMNKDGLLLK
jgi:hypothetical protein